MYNVLPKEVKEALKKEYRLRFLTVALWGLVATFLVVITGLLPSYFSVTIKEDQARRVQENLSRFKKSEDAKDVTLAFSSVKEKINLLEKKGPNLKAVGLVYKLFESKPKNISIGSVVYEKRDKNSIFVISGMAATRKDVTFFRDSIEKIEPFEKAELPVGILAKSANVPFTLTVTGSF